MFLFQVFIPAFSVLLTSSLEMEWIKKMLAKALLGDWFFFFSKCFDILLFYFYQTDELTCCAGSIYLGLLMTQLCFGAQVSQFGASWAVWVIIDMPERAIFCRYRMATWSYKPAELTFQYSAKYMETWTVLDLWKGQQIHRQHDDGWMKNVKNHQNNKVKSFPECRNKD